MYNHNKAQQSKTRVHISWDILYGTAGECPVSVGICTCQQWVWICADATISEYDILNKHEYQHLNKASSPTQGFDGLSNTYGIL